MAAAGESSSRAAADLERMSANGSTSLGRLTTSAQVHKEAWTSSGIALLGFGAAAVAGVGLAVKTFADFSAQMAQVQSLSHASGAEMEQLTSAALNMGQSIGFSATQVADGEIEMVKAGVSVKDIMGGALVGALTLAAAGQISVADATEIATIAMTQFGLAGKDVPHIADLLAAGADKALGGVSELGWALKTGGLVAHQFGLSLDDTVGTLALFAQNGLMGEAAGTDLRQMLLKLAAPSKTAATDMKTLGLVLYDSSGHFVGITSLAGQLHDKMQKLSEAERNAMEAHIFGARSIVGANILYQAGAKGVQGWIDAVNDSGFAAKQAAGKMDSLNGDMSKLQAAWETGMIQMGSSADGFVRPIIQGVTDVIHGFDALPEPIKGAILGVTGVVGAAALAGGAFLTLTPKILDTVSGFKQLMADGSKVPGMLGNISKAAGAAGAALVIVGAASAAFGKKGAPSADLMTDSIIKLSKAGQSASALDINFSKWDNIGGVGGPIGVNSFADAVQRLTHIDGFDRFNQLGDVIDRMAGAPVSGITQIQERMQALGTTMGTLATSGNLPLAAKGFEALSAEFAKNGKTAKDALDTVPGYRDALLNLSHQAKVTLNDQELLNYAAGKVPASMLTAADSVGVYNDSTGQSQSLSKDMAKALDAIGLSADGTISSLDKLVTSMEQAGLIQLSANDAMRNYYAALDAVDASIKKNGISLDIHTAAGRANQAALDAVAKASLGVVAANAKNGVSQEELSANLHTGYNDLMANYAAFGITGDAADTLARKALGIPKDANIDTAIQNYADSMLKLQGIETAADRAARARVSVITFLTDASGFYDPSLGHDGHGSGSGFLGTGPGHGFATGGLIGFATGGMVGGFPGGGLLQGAGTGTSDSMVARVSNGEFIQPTKSVQKYGVQFMEQVRAGTYQPAAAYAPAPSYGGSIGSSSVSAPDVRVYIGNEQIEARVQIIARAEANSAISAADRDSARRRVGV